MLKKILAGYIMKPLVITIPSLKVKEKDEDYAKAYCSEVSY